MKKSVRLLATRLAIALVALFGSARAHAEAPPELRSALVYSAPSACPDERRFVELLAQHSDVVIDRAAPLTLTVTVVTEAKRHRGRIALVVREEEGVREVSAERCEDVVRGLAIFSAIALDAYFARRPLESPSAVTPSGSPHDDASREEREEREANAPGAQRKPRPRQKKLEPQRHEPQKLEPQKLVPHFGIGLGEMNATGSRTLAYVDTFGQIQLARGPRSSLRAGLQLGAVAPQSYREGTLSFWMGWLRVDACPAWLLLGRGLSASLCATGDIGLQRAGLDDAVGGRSEAKPWLALGATARLRVRLDPKVELEASVAGLAPLRPLDFHTLSGIAYATPAFVPVVELALILPLSPRTPVTE